jgi:SHOCT-like protein
MSDESRRVLEMLSQGKVTVEEADQLLAALAPPPAASAQPAAAGREAAAPKFLRITVTRTRGGSGEEGGGRRSWMWPGYADEHRKEVTMRVPITLLKNGMRLGAILPGIYGEGLRAHLRERGVGIDPTKLDAATIDELVREFGEMNIDIDSGRSRKAQVRITCE